MNPDAPYNPETDVPSRAAPEDERQGSRHGDAERDEPLHERQGPAAPGERVSEGFDYDEDDQAQGG